MGDLKDPRVIYAKGFMFLFAGALAALLLVAEHPTLKVAILLGMAVWCFARFYYFAFYVIEHYVDPQFRFAGLGAFCVYLMTGRASVRQTEELHESAQADEGGAAPR
jgi:hypothetical protein